MENVLLFNARYTSKQTLYKAWWMIRESIYIKLSKNDPLLFLNW